VFRFDDGRSEGVRVYASARYNHAGGRRALRNVATQVLIIMGLRVTSFQLIPIFLLVHFV
jgi:hypothetical protein